MNFIRTFKNSFPTATRSALVAGLSLALVGCASLQHRAASEESEVPVLLENCPAPVQAALLAEAFKAGGVIGEIERETESDGSVVYEGTVNLPGDREIEVEVAPDGRVLEVEKP